MDPILREPAKECESDACEDESGPKAKDEVHGLLKCLGFDLLGDYVEGVEISKITLEVDLRKKRHC